MKREQIQRYVVETLGGNLTCREFVELVTDYLEGMLPFGRWVRFQLHLGVCIGCRNYLKQMKETVHRLEELTAAPPPEAVQEELRRRFQTWHRTRPAGA